MNCSKCNQPLVPGAQFCGNCGTPVPQAPAAPVAAVPPVPASTPTAPQPSVEATPAVAPPVAVPAATQPVGVAVPVNIPFFRKYWIFAAILLLLPVLIGLVILLTGEIYRKGKDGIYKTISKKEKTSLIIVAVLLQIYVIAHR